MLLSAAAGKLITMGQSNLRNDSGELLWVPEPVRLRRGRRYQNERRVPYPDRWRVGACQQLQPQDRPLLDECFGSELTLVTAADWVAATFQTVDHPLPTQYQKGAWLAILRQLWAVDWHSLAALCLERPGGLEWPQGYATRALVAHPGWLQIDYETTLGACLAAWIDQKPGTHH